MKAVKFMVVVDPTPKQTYMWAVISDKEAAEHTSLLKDTKNPDRFKKVADFVWGENKRVRHIGLDVRTKSCLVLAGKDLDKLGEHIQ